jgi:hypothetical protein
MVHSASCLCIRDRYLPGCIFPGESLGTRVAVSNSVQARLRRYVEIAAPGAALPVVRLTADQALMEEAVISKREQPRLSLRKDLGCGRIIHGCSGISSRLGFAYRTQKRQDLRALARAPVPGSFQRFARSRQKSFSKVIHALHLNPSISFGMFFMNSHHHKMAQ